MRTPWSTLRRKGLLAPKISTPTTLSILSISMISFPIPLFIYLFLFSDLILDPEHPYSLEQLSVLSEESITVDDKLGPSIFFFSDDVDSGVLEKSPKITFTPTIQHCSMATVIGLCLRVKLKHCFPPHYKVDIKVSPGSHANEESVNKQLNDKERIAAALENPNLRQLVDECLYSNEL
ncbi:unnamed protein product [Malus baccata var. baccata]